MAETDFYTKQSIDLAINKLKYHRIQSQLMSIELIGMMSTDESVAGEMAFYAATIDDILNGKDKSLSYAEKEQFLILHAAMVETYKEIKEEQRNQ
tara:strand:+ start:83 stop:367 length:285 start_codon:yes stop_codon:yes gene_type:complete